MNVTLPWPPKELSPNARLHWAALSRVKKQYRAACHAQAYMAGIRPGDLGPAKKAAVSLTFYPPDRRARDQDNMMASMKAGLDGLADALGLDDRNFRVTFDVADAIGGMVKVAIEPIAELEAA